MGKKLAVLAAAGAGYYFLKKELKNNPNGPLARAIRSVTENPKVVDVTNKTKEKVGEKVREQGEVVTDKVAEAVKDRLFRPADGHDNRPEYVDVQVEEIVVEPPSAR